MMADFANNFSSSPVYTDERFLKLSQKITQLQNLELKNPNKLSHVESKLDYLEVNVLKSIKDYELKYKFLQDEMIYLNKMIEDDRSNKENLKSKIGLELVNFEQKIKTSFQLERESMTNLLNSLTKTLESEIIKMELTLKKEKEEIIAAVQSIKEIIEIDLPKLNEKVDECSDNKNSQIKNIVESMNGELKYLYNLV